MGICMPLTFTFTSLFVGYRSISLEEKTFGYAYAHGNQISFSSQTHKYSHVSDLHIDVVLFNLVLLQQNHEFELLGAILGQNLVARQGHLVLVPPVVECGQGVLGEATLSWNGGKNKNSIY